MPSGNLKSVNRRSILKTASALTVPTFLPKNVFGANEKKINIWINENHVVIDGCVNPHLTGDVDELFDEVLAMKIDLARGLASERVLSNEVLHHAI